LPWTPQITGEQVPACVVSHQPKARVLRGSRAGGENVRHQPGLSWPGSRVGRVTGVTSGQDRLGARAGGSGLVRGEPVAKNDVGEAVYLHTEVIDPGQRLACELRQGVPPGLRKRACTRVLPLAAAYRVTEQRRNTAGYPNQEASTVKDDAVHLRS
jgi:hypothetical protein